LPLSAQREEAVAIDGQVQAVAGVVDVALGELLGDGGGAYAGAGNLAAGAENGGRVDVGELGARALEAGGGDVGDVVAGNGEILVGRGQTAQSDVERHGDTPFRNRLLADGQYAGERQTPHASQVQMQDRKSTRLNSSHVKISYAVFCLKKKNRNRGVKCRTSGSDQAQLE